MPNSHDFYELGILLLLFYSGIELGKKSDKHEVNKLKDRVKRLEEILNIEKAESD